MANDDYTLILIPDARSAPRKIRISKRLVRWIRRAMGVAALAAAGLLAHYVWLNWQVSELDALRLQNTALSVQTQDYNVSLGRFEGQLSLLQRTVAKLGVISGVEQGAAGTYGAIGGFGGVSGIEATPPLRDPDVIAAQLSRRLSELATRSTRLESFYADQQELLAHTPSIWPVRGYLSSGYGRRNDPFTGRRIFHPGIDVSAPRGSEVTAPADGRVVAVGRRGAYGKAIIIDHGQDIVTRYGHLQDYNVRAGQPVRRGDVIGFVGSTGRSNGPHLHYEVWVRDRLQNPVHYILEEYRSFGRS
jgi:murein DD-endopeptidase MepM/ murein hydrolase activator NlpD